MKKKLLLVLLLNLGALSMSPSNAAIANNDNPNTGLELQQLKYGNGYLAVGNINTSITDQIKLKPDTAEFSITYITEGTTPNDASNRNAENMKKFKEYLIQLGLKDDNLTTVAYQNYENEKQQPVGNKSMQYKSTFTINLSITNKQFFDVVKLLDENNINDIQQDSYQKYYIFKIQQISDTAEKAKQLNQQKYQQIVAQLNKLGINDITVAGYDNQVVSPSSEMVKKYYVQNTTEIKVTNFDLLGKIISKAQELKMMVNNDMHYSVSATEKDRILAEHEQVIYQKLADKATRLLGKQYQLGIPTNLNSHDNNIYEVQPRSYGYSRSMINASQSQNFMADEVDIQTPSEFSMTLTMTGTFEIVKKIAQ